jgi:hypothetical protein
MKINGLLFALLLITVALATYFVTLMLIPKRVGLKYKTTDKNVEDLMDKINAKLDSYQGMCDKDILPVVQKYLTGASDKLSNLCGSDGSGVQLIISEITLYLNRVLDKYTKNTSITGPLNSIITLILTTYIPVVCSYNTTNNKKIDQIISMVLNILSAIC